MLAFSEYGDTNAAVPLVIAHGLFGSGRNWRVIARRLSEGRRVITPDMRNHGDSLQDASHGYPDLARDLAELIDHIGGPVDLCGHSMGGKAAMALALTRPDLVRRLIVADIAPVAYAHSQQDAIDAMRQVDLTALTRRSDATGALADAGVAPELQGFFTQSLDVSARRWRLNLDALEDQMPLILGWPEDLTGAFEGPALFLSGGASDYVQRTHRPRIKTLFPKARFATLPGAGHWLHAEKPRDFEATVTAFLTYEPPLEA